MSLSEQSNSKFSNLRDFESDIFSAGVSRREGGWVQSTVWGDDGHPMAYLSLPTARELRHAIAPKAKSKRHNLDGECGARHARAKRRGGSWLDGGLGQTGPQSPTQARACVARSAPMSGEPPIPGRGLFGLSLTQRRPAVNKILEFCAFFLTAELAGL